MALSYGECNGPCAKANYATQRRNAYCMSLGGHVVSNIKCNPKNKPTLIKECSSKECVAEWKPEPWTEVRRFFMFNIHYSVSRGCSRVFRRESKHNSFFFLLCSVHGLVEIMGSSTEDLSVYTARQENQFPRITVHVRTDQR